MVSRASGASYGSWSDDAKTYCGQISLCHSDHGRVAVATGKMRNSLALSDYSRNEFRYLESNLLTQLSWRQRSRLD